jgi:alpha-tubulin suppressor-like RCC1 family protein
VGQLGDGTTTTIAPYGKPTPVSVTGLSTGVTAIAGGGRHSLAIQNGAAKAWGLGSDGRLGNGSNADSSVPVSVTDLSAGVTAVAGGEYHSLAIQNGAAKAWGDGSNLQLGNGSNADSNVPVSVTGLSTGVTAVAGGALHSLAIHNGAAKAWGAGGDGQLGNGLNVSSNVPVSVTGLSTGVTAIAGGTYHSLAIKDGNVYAWGYDHQEALGNGASLGSSNVTVQVLDLSIDLIDVAAGYQSSYALSSDGSLWVWGYNADGQLGLGNTTNQEYPQQLLAPSGYRFTAISAGPSSSHAVATIAVIPEPVAVSVLALGGVLLIRRRRGARR